MKKILQIIRIILNSIFNITIVLLLLVLLYTCYNRFILKDSSSIIKDYYFFKVVSGSMEPELKVGDYILVHKQDNYKTGDIITYYDGVGYVTHRIKEMSKTEVIAQGDANNTEDEPINKKSIKGKYVKKINKFGKMYEFFKNKQTILIIIGAVIILKIGALLLGKK